MHTEKVKDGLFAYFLYEILQNSAINRRIHLVLRLILTNFYAKIEIGRTQSVIRCRV